MGLCGWFQLSRLSLQIIWKQEQWKDPLKNPDKIVSNFLQQRSLESTKNDKYVSVF